MTYEQAIEKIHSLLTFGSRPGLDRMRIFLEKLGNPHLRIKAARNEQLHHRIRHANMIVEHAQRDGVDRAVGEPVEGPAEIIKPVVRVDGRNDGDFDRPL